LDRIHRQRSARPQRQAQPQLSLTPLRYRDALNNADVALELSLFTRKGAAKPAVKQVLPAVLMTWTVTPPTFAGTGSGDATRLPPLPSIVRLGVRGDPTLPARSLIVRIPS
jgi:hypothetical protein